MIGEFILEVAKFYKTSCNCCNCCTTKRKKKLTAMVHAYHLTQLHVTFDF